MAREPNFKASSKDSSLNVLFSQDKYVGQQQQQYLSSQFAGFLNVEETSCNYDGNSGKSCVRN